MGGKGLFLYCVAFHRMERRDVLLLISGCRWMSSAVSDVDCFIVSVVPLLLAVCPMCILPNTQQSLKFIQ